MRRLGTRPSASAMSAGIRVNRICPVEEGRHRDLVGGVQDGRGAIACLERLPGQAETRKAIGIGLLERQRADPRQVEPLRRDRAAGVDR